MFAFLGTAIKVLRVVAIVSTNILNICLVVRKFKFA